MSSFLSNVYFESENRLLPNDLIVLRNKGEDQQGPGEGLGGVEDQQGCPDQDGGPNPTPYATWESVLVRPVLGVRTKTDSQVAYGVGFGRT